MYISIMCWNNNSRHVDAEQISGSWFGLCRYPLYIPFHLKHYIWIITQSQLIIIQFPSFYHLRALSIDTSNWRHVTTWCWMWTRTWSCPRRPRRRRGTRPSTGWPSSWWWSHTDAFWRRSTCWWLVTSSKRSGGKVALSLGLKLLFRHPSFCWFKVFKLPRDENHSATTIFHFHGVRLDAWTPWLTTRQPATFGLKLCHLTLCLS